MQSSSSYGTPSCRRILLFQTRIKLRFTNWWNTLKHRRKEEKNKVGGELFILCFEIIQDFFILILIQILMYFCFQFEKSHKLKIMFSQGRFKTGPQKSSRPTTGKKAPPPKTHISSIEQDNIQQLIEQLIVNQKECEKNGQYVEAETFKRKIKILREQADQNELAEMKNRHVKERQQIQQAHFEELNCFNIEWDQRIVSLNSQIEKMEEELTLKQAAEIKQIEDQMMSDKPHKFKESGTLLNLRRIQMELAKQQNYMEARQVQIKAQKLQKEELEKWRKNQTSKCKNSLNVLKNKHENELKVLQQRIQLTIQEKNRQRMQQEQKIVLKYQNVIRELEFQQKQEIQRLQKSNKLASLHTKTKAGLLSTSKASFR